MTLSAYLPPYYHSVTEMAALLDAEDAELSALRENMEKVISESLIEQAPSDVIAVWEKQLGLIAGGTLEQRRMAVLARVRGQGDLDQQKIYDVISAFTGADQSALVDFNDGVLSVSVLPSAVGEIYRYKEIEKALRPLVPAHIALSMQRFYATWNDVKNTTANWNQLQASYEDWGEIYALIPEVE